MRAKRSPSTDKSPELRSLSAEAELLRKAQQEEWDRSQKIWGHKVDRPKLDRGGEPLWLIEIHSED